MISYSPLCLSRQCTHVACGGGEDSTHPSAQRRSAATTQRRRQAVHHRQLDNWKQAEMHMHEGWIS